MTKTTKNLTSLTATTFFAVLLGLSFGNQDAYAQSFPDFSDLTGLTLNNDAAQSGTDLRLVPALTGQSGSAFFDSTVGIEQFTTQFEFELSALGVSDGSDLGADGIVFTIQNDAAADAALGTGGGSLGYVGISPSVGVSFDHWINGFDTQENISIHSGGSITKLAEAAFEFDPDTTYTVWIDYDGITLEIFISTTNVKPGAPSLTHVIDIPTTVGSSDAYVGFTASTGAAVGNHDILSWNFVSIVDVDIDIKPGSDPSSVNCKKIKGGVPVAIFGSDTFDVSTIDLGTLQLNGVDVTEIHDKIHIEDKKR